jgi:molybdopterin converting factor small subunit
MNFEKQSTTSHTEGGSNMSILIRIPSPLRGFTNGLKTVEAEGKTVSEVLQDLNTKFPGIHDRLYDQKTGRPLTNIYLNNEDIRILNKEKGRYETAIIHYPPHRGRHCEAIAIYRKLYESKIQNTKIIRQKSSKCHI